MANQLHRVSNHKWPGVYCYESESRKHQGKMDVCYYYTFKIDGVKKTQKVGWASEGYSPQIAAEERAKKVRKKRHGGKVRTDKEIRREHQRRNRTLGEIKKAYFESDRGRI